MLIPNLLGNRLGVWVPTIRRPATSHPAPRRSLVAPQHHAWEYTTATQTRVPSHLIYTAGHTAPSDSNASFYVAYIGEFLYR